MEKQPIAVPTVRDLLDSGGLATHFLPVISVRRRDVVAWEALVRGPHNSPLFPSIPLLHAAAAEGLAIEFEVRAVRLAVESFRAHNPGCQLWLNLNRDLLTDQTYLSVVQTTLLELQVSSQLVLLIARFGPHVSESRFPAFARSLNSLAPYRVVVAFDELPESGAALEYLQHHGGLGYLKIGRHIIRDVTASSVKRVHLQGLTHRASGREVRVIAEGIESETELLVLRSLGVDMAQGYLFSRPAPDPVIDLSPLKLIQDTNITPFGGGERVGDLVEVVPYLTVNSSLAAFEHYLMQQPGLTAIPVLEGSFPVGYLVPDDHDGLVAGRSVADLIRTNFVVLQAHDEIEDLDRAMERPGVVCVVWDGIYQGIVPESHWKDRFPA